MTKPFKFEERIMKVKVGKDVDEKGNVSYVYLINRREPKGSIGKERK